MSYGGDRYGGNGGNGGGSGYGGGDGGEAGSYYQQGNRFDDGARGDDRRDNYGGAGRNDHGRQGGGADSYGGNQGGYDRPSGGQGGYGRNDYESRPSGGSGGYGGKQGGYDRPSGGQGDYGRDDYNDRPSGGSGGQGGYGREDRNDRPSGGSGGYSGQEDRYGAPGKAYSGPQSDQESTPYDAPASSGYSGPHRPGRQSGGGYGGGQDLDDDEVMNNADKDDDKGFFSSALSFLKGKNKDDDDDDIDEGRIQQQHDKLYQGRPDDKQDSNSLGAAAAMHAFQMFNGGDQKQSSGGSQNKLLGMAFKEASNLFENQNNQGNVQGGVDKQSVINSAGKYALKMYLKNGAGGGSSGLLGMASKFL